MRNFQIGLVGVDSSHSIAFTKLLNDPSEKHHIKGGKVVTAYPGGSPDFKRSISRVEGFSKNLQENFNVRIVQSIEDVAKESDAIILGSADGRVHFNQFKKIAIYQKPVFIDKPLCLTTMDSRKIIELSRECNTPIMSTSALRYAEGLTKILQTSSIGRITGADCFGPIEFEKTQPGYFWYGIHTVEMLVAILGNGIEYVTVESNQNHDFLTGVWKDGRIGTIRGLSNSSNFGGVVHFDQNYENFSILPDHKPFYASLLEQIICFFQNGVPSVKPEETHEIIRFIEAANESSLTGKRVYLSP